MINQSGVGQLGVPSGLITRRSVVQIHTPLFCILQFLRLQDFCKRSKHREFYIQMISLSTDYYEKNLNRLICSFVP